MPNLSKRKSPSANSENCIVAQIQNTKSKTKVNVIEHGNWCEGKRFEIISVPKGAKYRYEPDDSVYIPANRTHYGRI